MSDSEPLKPGESETTSVEYEGPPATFSKREWPRPWMGAFLDTMAISPSATGAARAAGVNRQYAYEAADRWPEFKAGWAEAREVGIELFEMNTIRWGTFGLDVVEVKERRDGAGNLIERTETKTKHVSPSLAMFILKRFRPEYRESYTIAHGGADGGPVRLEVERAPTRERMLELAQLAQQLALPPGVPEIIDAPSSSDSE